jgi:hypothetical protein
MRKSKKTRKGSARRTLLRTQREVLRDVMLSAGECDAWLTLHELARLTQYGEASISAQLRHLRKPLYGGFVLEKRQRESSVLRGTESGTVWEYQLRGKIRRTVQRASVRGWGEHLAAIPALLAQASYAGEPAVC